MGLETRIPPEGRLATRAGDPAPVEGDPASSPPELRATGLGASATDLPPIAAKANDLEAIRKAVDDAASVSGGLWISYLFVLFYLAVAAGAVTHEDLFFERAVKLPFLNVELPLLAFFFLAPILFLIVHAYTLVHLVMLTDKAKRYDESLDTQINESGDLSNDERTRRADIHAGLRQQLPSNIFVQFLAGPKELRESPFGWALRAIAWITLVIAPVLLLLLMQLQFLPFHSSFITWTHRLALLADLALVWWLWSKIVSGREAERRNPTTALNLFEIAVILSFIAVLFSWAIATFPGEWQEDLLAKWDRPKWTVTPHDWLFSGPVGQTTRRRTSLFSNTLVLPGLNIYEGLRIDDPEKAKWHDYVFRARGRDLRGAIFDLAILPKVDLEGAELRGASFQFAHLEGASLVSAKLQGASLFNAHLEGAALDFAQLAGASLIGAHLEGASLVVAQLQGASLDLAQLQGASLVYGQLLGASLEGTQLQAASLAGAQLQGSSLQEAHLEATDLSLALLWRSNRRGRLFGQPPSPAAIKLPDPPDHWLPSWKEHFVDKAQPWNDEAYQKLRQVVDSIPWGVLRNQAQKRIQSLDCANKDPTLASCDPSAPPPPEAIGWREVVEHSRVDDTAYKKALASALKTLLCSGDSASILRKLTQTSPMGLPPGRFAAAGPEASPLIDFIMSKDCPVSILLTDADRAKLLQIKQGVIGHCEQRNGVFRRSRVFERCVGAEEAGKKTAP